MKKLIALFLLLTLALGGSATVASAHCGGHGSCATAAVCAYVDDDCDGVCDNCGKCHAPAVRRTVRRSHHHGHCH